MEDKDTIYRWECEVCDKKIKALHPKQLEHWKKQHMLTHEE